MKALANRFVLLILVVSAMSNVMSWPEFASLCAVEMMIVEAERFAKD